MASRSFFRISEASRSTFRSTRHRWIWMRPVRRVLPTFRGMDFSPLVVLLAANALLLFILPLSDGRILF